MKVMKCPGNCAHPYQDKAYGAGMRAFTTGKDSHRCSVCGHEITIAKHIPAPAKKES